MSLRPQQIRSFHSTAKKLDFSKMVIVGRIGSEYSEFTSLNNNRYIRYSIASQPRRDSPTNWYNITVFNENQINFLTNYVRKGALVYVEADAANFAYEKEDGTRGTRLSLVQKEISLLKNASRPEDTVAAAAASASASAPASEENQEAKS